MKKHSINSGIKGRKAFNNGTKVIYLTDQQEIPNGFKPGGLSKRTHEESVLLGKKSSLTQKQAWNNKTQEEKDLWANKCRDIQLNIPKEKRLSMIIKANHTNNSKSKDEQTFINLKRSKRCKEFWNKSSKEFKQEFVQKISETCLEKYGVPYYCMTQDCRSASSNDSKPNLEFANLLNKYNISYEREFDLDKYSFDFKVNNILIEIDPTITHNSTISSFPHRGPIEKYYHINKSSVAFNSNYQCIHIWDWDNKEKIINLLLPKEKIYARNCLIKELDKKSLDSFLSNYHIQDTCKNQTIKLGLYYKDILVQVMTFGKPRYNKKYEYELLRLCSLPYYLVIGGSKKLFKYFLDNYKPSSIISYCDNSKFRGSIYINLGFTLLKKNIPSKHWFNIKTKQHITDNLLRQRGYDQLFNTNYGKGTSNEELMLNNGFVELYDCGQSVYIYKNK